jgi:hypothetical protein
MSPMLQRLRLKRSPNCHKICIFPRSSTPAHLLVVPKSLPITSRFIQNAVVRRAIAEVHTNRELVSFENHVSIYPNSARLLHSRSPFLCALERVDPWELIASRGDRPSHPISVNAVIVEVEFTTKADGALFRFPSYQSWQSSGSVTGRIYQQLW